MKWNDVTLLTMLYRELRKRNGDSPAASGMAQPIQLLEWAKTFLPNHFVQPASKMHRWLAGELDQSQTERGTKLNVLAPRGSAKSTVATLAFPLRELLENREPYIWIISDTMSQAHTHLENIKTELTENRKLKQKYPDAFGKGSIWRTGSITLRNGTVIEAFGTGQQLRGRRRKENRPTLMICDDLQNDQHIVSASARERCRNWFHGTLLKAGDERTNIIHLATALHREAIALELFDTPGWKNKVFKAVEKFPTNIPLWKEWERIYTMLSNPNHSRDAGLFYGRNRDAMNEGAELLWEEHESLYDLMKMRVESGYTAFEREKQNSPVNPDLCEFPDEYFDESIWYRSLPKSITATVLALDPSKGKDSSLGDYSAFVLVFAGSDGTFYIDAKMERQPMSDMIDTGIELYRQHRPAIFGIETNQFQELLQSEFESKFESLGLSDAVIYPMTNTVNKRVRIRRLEPMLSAKRLKFRDNTACRLLVDQLRSFPIGDHDDGPDALEMALRLVEPLIN
jgi:predicted phage terminase large subunit-like protein